MDEGGRRLAVVTDQRAPGKLGGLLVGRTRQGAASVLQTGGQPSVLCLESTDTAGVLESDVGDDLAETDRPRWGGLTHASTGQLAKTPDANASAAQSTHIRVPWRSGPMSAR